MGDGRWEMGNGGKSRKTGPKSSTSQNAHDPTPSAPRETGIERANKDEMMLFIFSLYVLLLYVLHVVGPEYVLEDAVLITLVMIQVVLWSIGTLS